MAGTGEGEAFRNSILRGADPRLSGDKAAERTADASEEQVDLLEEIASNLGGGLGVATIAVA